MKAGSAGSGGTTMAPKPVTAEDITKRFHECWSFWNDGKWDLFKGCYAEHAIDEAPGSEMPALSSPNAVVDVMKAYRLAAPDEKAMPELVLVSGKKVAAVILLTGKQTGALKMPGLDVPATKKPFGFYMGQVLAIDDSGKVSHEWEFFDTATMLGQLTPMKDHPVRAVVDKLPKGEEVVVAKDDQKEHANLATVQQLVEGFNKHDVKAFGGLLADDLVWSEQPSPKDQTKKELVAELPRLWKGFSDLKFAMGEAWAAGDYVVATETFEGTNDGDLPMMHVKKTGKKVSLPFLAIHKLEGGKVKATWIFFQGGGLATQLGLAVGDHAATKPAAQKK